MRRSKRAHVQLKKKCATLHEELNEIEHLVSVYTPFAVT